MKKIILLIAGVLFLSASLLWLREAREIRSERLFLSDVLVELKARGTDAECRAAFSRAADELARIDSRLGYEDSLIDRLNRDKILKNKEVYDLISFSLDVHRASSGAFSITLRSILDAWGFTGLHPCRIPFAGEYALWRNSPKDGAVRLLDDGMTVRIPAGTSIDIGGSLEGYAVDRACAAMKAAGAGTGLVNVGGEVMAFGSRTWKVGVKNPRGNGIFAVIPLKDRAIATSGDYERFLVQGQTRYCHILDPATGWPGQGIMSASVIAENCLKANAWAVALFVAGPDRLGPVLERMGMDWIVVDTEGQVRASSAMQPYCPVRVAAGRP